MASLLLPVAASCARSLASNCLSSSFFTMLGYAHGPDGYTWHPICSAGSQSISRRKARRHARQHKTHGQVKWIKWDHVFANSKADDAIPSEMSVEIALQLLGVSEGASFEEILKAKKALLTQSSEDQELAIQVEAAYDLLLMNSFMQRQSGKVADSSILYADVKNAKSVSKFLGVGPEWLKSAFSKVPVVVEPPSATDLGIQSAVFAALMVWTYSSAMPSSVREASMNAHADVPGLTLAAGFSACLYFLRQQNLKLGKAAAITVSALVAGAIFGGAVESWLRVDIIPVFGVGSPAAVVSEFVLLSLWLSSLYLR